MHPLEAHPARGNAGAKRASEQHGRRMSEARQRGARVVPPLCMHLLKAHNVRKDAGGIGCQSKRARGAPGGCQKGVRGMFEDTGKRGVSVSGGSCARTC